MFKGEQSRESLTGNIRTKCFSLCCSYGAVKLSPKGTTRDAKRCIDWQHKRDHDFRTNIRAYNSSFAFASVLLTGNEYEFKTRGSYYYRINGQVYHAISQMQPEKDGKARFSQIYIFDDKQNELDHRLNSFDKSDGGLPGELHDMIKEIYIFAAANQQAGNMARDKPTEDIRLVLRSQVLQ